MTDHPLTQNSPFDARAESSGKQVDSSEHENLVQLSRAEAKQAWLTAGGDSDRAARQALRDRLAKVTNLSYIKQLHRIILNINSYSTHLFVFLALLFFFILHLQVKELCALGFSDEGHCHEVLRQSGGQMTGALALLQRPLLEPFHKHIWSEKHEPPVDLHHPDKLVRLAWTHK